MPRMQNSLTSPVKTRILLLLLLITGAAAPNTLSTTWPGRVPLIDQDNHPLTLAQFRGSLLVLNFIFTGCGATCPAQTADLAKVQRALPPSLQPPVHFVSVSIDPVNDVPSALKAFATTRGADLATWSFVTGDPGQLRRLAEKFQALAPPGPLQPGTAHSTDIRLFDTSGVERQRYAGAPVDISRLIREIQQLARLEPQHALPE